MHYEERPGARELKFLLAPGQAAQVRQWARATLAPDPFAASGGDTYRVTSLYYDTAAFDAFHRHGSYGRAKYRVRRYDGAEAVFVERKLKTRDYVTKRRSLVGITELAALGSGRTESSWAGFWFDRRLAARHLEPVCAISYLRTARVAGAIRLTLDEDLRALQVSGRPALIDVSHGTEIAPGQHVLELKFRGAMPGLFKQLLESIPLRRSAMSKYRTAASALGLAESHD